MILPLFLFALFLISIVAGFLAWYFIWYKPGLCQIPLSEKLPSQQQQARQTNILPVRDFLKLFFRYCLDFDSSFWIKHCGLDGYSFLYIQRKVVKMICIFFIEYIAIRCFFSIVSSEELTWQFFGTHTTDVDFQSSKVLKIQCSLIITYTITLMITFLKVVEHMRKVYLSYYNDNDSLDLKYLLIRSLHIRGLVEEDIKGDILKKQIQEYLKNNGGGKMLALLMIPNYSDLIGYEAERKENSLMWRIIQSNERYLNRFWIPKRFRDKIMFEKEQSILDDNIQRETERRFLSSGHAIICFDSLKTVEKVSEFLKMDPKKIINYTLGRAGDLANFRMNIFRRSMRTSTFMKFEDETENIVEKYSKVELFMKEAPESLDIIWRNMGGSRGMFLYRRILTIGSALVILFFLTTPNEIFRVFNENIFNLSDFQWAFNISENFGIVMKNIIPPAFYLAVNSILILLINLASLFENHSNYSEYQIAVFNKAAFYLTFNMLVIPGLSYNLQTSFFTVLKENITKLDVLLYNFYSLDSGSFFIIILAQTAVMFPTMYMLRIADIIRWYASPWILYFRRQFLNDVENWMKDPREIFKYGYNGARMTTIFFIIMLYSTTLPVLMPFGVLFYFIEHIVDAYNLLTFHKTEIDSFGKLFKKIVMSMILYAILFQVILIGAWCANGAYLSIGFLVVNIMLLLSFYLYLQRPFFSILELEKQIKEFEKVDENYIEEWKKHYRHPLILKDQEYEVPQIQLDPIIETVLNKNAGLKNPDASLEVDMSMAQQPRASLIANY